LNGTRRQGPLQLSWGFVAAAAFGAGILFSSIAWDRGAATKRPAPISFPPVHLVQATARDVVGSPIPDYSSVRIGIDATRTAVADANTVQAMRVAVEAFLSRVRADLPAGEVAADRENLNPLAWARFRGDAVRVYWHASGPVQGLDVYAERTPQGTSVAVSNRTGNDIMLAARIRLPGRPYKIEQLTLAPTGSRRLAASRGNNQGSQAPLQPGTAHLSRLMGRCLAVTSAIELPLNVSAGSVEILRFTDTAYACRTALNDVRDQLRHLPHASSDLAQRLHVVFEGSGRLESALSPSSAPNTDERLRGIHRFLLIIGQAHSLLRNYQVRDAVQERAGTELRAALERLNDALADASATIIGLVPSIELSQNPPAARQTSQLRAAFATARDEDEHVLYATVTLANRGGRSAELVKIGIDRSSLPPEETCDPSEPALLGTIAPGQTGRATFTIRARDQHSISGAKYAGDISYFTAGAPAHLRPQTW
jgi:hypothetical protein